MEKAIRLGILGPGAIFRRVMKDMPNAKGVKVTAVASRDARRAAEAAALAGAKHAYGSYEELAASEDVDLVYIATPHPFHMEQAILMMEHGKHVLCEKPMALNEQETLRMQECAKRNHVFLMEAMWTRFFPAWRCARKRIASGAIGDVLHITTGFSYRATGLSRSHRLWNPALAGGGLLDVGVYCLEAITNVLGWEPSAVQGLCRKADTGVDARFSVQMIYPCGATAQLIAGCDVSTDSTMIIYGAKGKITMPDFWHPTFLAVDYANGEHEEHRFPAENEGHHYEFEHAAECIRMGRVESPEMSFAETLAVARMMTELRRENGIIYPREEG